MIITAAVTESKGAPFRIQELELSDLRADELLVKVVAAGICHTDLIVRDQWYPSPLPAVLGHEGAGVVERVGSQVAKVREGDTVAMSYHSCGRCPTCQTGRPNYCHHAFQHNFGAARPDGSSCLSRDGQPVHAHFFGQSSFATHSVANERNVTPLGPELPLDLIAPFGCGLQTGAGAVLNSLRPEAGSGIAVFGTGAVGLSAVMGAVIAGCTTIVGVDLVRSRLTLASELGATHVVNGSEDDAPEAIRKVTGGMGVQYAIDTTGVPSVFRQALESTAPTGVCVLVGAAAFGTEVSLEMSSILTRGRTIRGVIEGDSVPDLFIPRLIDLWSRGSFPADRLITHYDFEQINEAARDAEQGRVVKPVLRIG